MDMNYIVMDTNANELYCHGH